MHAQTGKRVYTTLFLVFVRLPIYIREPRSDKSCFHYLWIQVEQNAMLAVKMIQKYTTVVDLKFEHAAVLSLPKVC